MSRWAPLPQSLRTLAAASPHAVLLETSRFDEQNHHSYLFLNPAEVFLANTPEQLSSLFEWMETMRKRGLYLAGYFGYECGYSLDYRVASIPLFSLDTDSPPLAWFGAYPSPFIFDHATGTFLGAVPPNASSVKAPEVFTTEVFLGISEEDYKKKILRIKQYIEAGDTYQVNFTDSVTVSSPHDAAAAFTVLSTAQPVAYSALLHIGDHHILSLSPELFFSIHNGHIVTRPMKGTMPRGFDIFEDEHQAALLAADEKNRSEHVMIVDLLRNDLGRICRMGSVHTNQLFTVERYKTLFQMTSAISGELRDNLTLYEIFRALFPSGSITGAPKIRTMQIIRELERHPRGVYTGSIGYIAPSGDAVFNVAIRTLVLHNGIAHMGVGGGIVADSDPLSEYRECQLKSSFLTQHVPRFQLIETMLCESGKIDLLPLHLERLASSAAYFDFALDRTALTSQLNQFIAALPSGQRHRIRLLLDANGHASLTSSLLESPGTAPLTVRLSKHRVSSNDPLLRHKTTQRELYNREFQNVLQEGYDEVLFLNQRDELTEGAISTLFLQLDGRLVTPPLSSGVLPGVLRQHILSIRTDSEERPLFLDDLLRAEAVFLGNSVRGLRLVARIEREDGLSPPILLKTSS
ncbi:MAG TPA: aminodeoxychorismate synthase component I [Edaphobacter sp.]|jgi:para-aminobenzoate synthetase/4-amino-4-deoxychorismate lyase|nr:aminodeoxychorismate synthase component I [Edaphobacter sp.]